jgi:hypothetical protein
MQNQELKRVELYNLLGKLPDKNREAKLLNKVVSYKDKFILEKLVLDLNGLQDAPAYFICPLNFKEKKGKLPTVNLTTHTEVSIILARMN